MGSPVETTLPTPEVDRGRVRAVRIATVACLLVTLPSLILPVMFALVLWRLRQRTVKKGLALAVGMGSVGWIALALVVSPIAKPGDWPFWWVLLCGVAQAFLVQAAVRTYYTMASEPGDRRMLVSTGFGPPVAAALMLFLAFVFVIEFFLFPRHPESHAPHNEYAAVSVLIATNSAASSYASTYQNGLPPNLATLGPPPKATASNSNHADL